MIVIVWYSSIVNFKFYLNNINKFELQITKINQFVLFFILDISTSHYCDFFSSNGADLVGLGWSSVSSNSGFSNKCLNCLDNFPISAPSI